MQTIECHAFPPLPDVHHEVKKQQATEERIDEAYFSDTASSNLLSVDTQSVHAYSCTESIKSPSLTTSSPWSTDQASGGPPSLRLVPTIEMIPPWGPRPSSPRRLSADSAYLTVQFPSSPRAPIEHAHLDSTSTLYHVIEREAPLTPKHADFMFPDMVTTPTLTAKSAQTLGPSEPVATRPVSMLPESSFPTLPVISDTTPAFQWDTVPVQAQIYVYYPTASNGTQGTPQYFAYIPPTLQANYTFPQKPETTASDPWLTGARFSSTSPPTLFDAADEPDSPDSSVMPYSSARSWNESQAGGAPANARTSRIRFAEHATEHTAQEYEERKEFYRATLKKKVKRASGLMGVLRWEMKCVHDDMGVGVREWKSRLLEKFRREPSEE